MILLELTKYNGSPDVMCYLLNFFAQAAYVITAN